MPARHLGAIRGATAQLMVHVVAAVKDWQRFPSFRERSATADVAPSEWRSGPTVHGPPKVSTIGSPYLRQAIYVMTTSVVWHEPTCGLSCVQRKLYSRPLVPTIMQVGRNMANTALAILKTDQPFRARSQDPAAAREPRHQ